MFALRGLSLDICKAIFAAALKSRSYIVFDGEFAFAPAGSAAAPREDFIPIKTVASPDELYDVLNSGFGIFSDFLGRVREVDTPHS